MYKFIFSFVFFVVLGIAAFVCIKWYPFIFAKNVEGKIETVERVSNASAIIATGQSVPDSQVFSFAIAVRDKKDEIHTASSEDRQWAVVQSGQCVIVKMLPYPPWRFEKAGTFFGARLIRLFDCEK